MAEDLGNGVSRTLSAAERQFQFVVWQADKPPLDSELNLVGQIVENKSSLVLRSSLRSGFLLDPLSSERDYVTNPSFSNRFLLGAQGSGEEEPVLWASVNGWLVPVTGTMTPDGDTSNQINLFPPPSSDTRIDLVFLEVWQAQVAPNPSSLNKPTPSTLWRYGNVMFGGTNLPDDLEDPNIGMETTERVQLQYRLRVFGNGTGLGASVDLSRYPDGLDDPNVRGQGAGNLPSSFQFENMRQELGDPGLWRAGNGDATNALGTIDGYTYAIPVCAVFRRNSQPFVAIEAGNANQNGSLNRNPFSVAITNPAEGAASFGELSLTSGISSSSTGAVSVTGLTGSGFANPNLDWTSTFIVIDDEIIGLSSVSLSGNTITINGRGRWGTQALPHEAGTKVRFFNWRQDGLFADQITGTDILDLRRSVKLGGWDYQSLLVGNLTKLFKNQLHSSYKQSGVSSGDVQGVVIPEIDSLYAVAPVPAQTESLDGPDGIRTLFSDAATVQADVTVYAEAPAGAGTVASYAPSTGWEVAAGFVPDGFGVAAGWSNGSVLNLYIGGQNGNSAARRSVKTSADNRIVRFLPPREAWLSRDNDSSLGRQTPVTLRFIGSSSSPNSGIATEPAADGLAASPGPVYPLPEFNFEKPFIVLGGLVNSTLQSSTAEAKSGVNPTVQITGVNFDTPGVYYPTTGVSVNDPTLCSEPLLHGTRTLWDLLTAGGTDLSGKSSELYLVLYGDTTNPTVTNGAFRVIGAGTVGYTTNGGGAADRVRVEFIREVGGPSQFVVDTPNLTAELRSQYTHTEDDDGRVAGPSALTIVLTDLAGTSGSTTNPWNGDFSLPLVSDLVVNTSLVYGPSRGGTARVANEIHRFAVVNPTTDSFVRVSPSTYDTSFPFSASVPSNEAYFPPQPLQTWNRLSSLGLTAPSAPSYGGNRVVFTEQDREAELFVDAGSKSVFFRPLVKREMTLVKRTVPLPGALIPATYPNGNLVDSEGFFVSTRREGYALPPEFMPRFGRQDIPFHTVDPLAPGAGDVLFGINHLFCDSPTTTDSVFNVLVGGSAAGVTPSMLLQTDGSSGLDYGEYGPISGGGSGYQGRLFSDVNIISSDTGRGMRGIQLPPFLGIGRLYGVYDARDWAGIGAFDPDRISPSTGGATNLLRTDKDKQTLFLKQGGAADFTNNANDHTYIIPADAIDVRLSPSYTAGEKFEDLDYVVEFIAFGFSRGFINLNNYVLARAATPLAGGLPADFVNDLNMIINAPAKYPTQTYVGYSRTVYQGDPYMTRAGSVRVTSDYQVRYGQVPVTSAQEASSPIQQFSLTGEQIPEKVNPRPLEVLASLDFYTTLGTGKVGGRIYAGTPLDVAHLQSGSRVPTSTANPLQSLPRTFTEAPSQESPRASASVSVNDNALVIAGNVVTLSRGANSVTFTGGVNFTGASAAATARSLAVAINASATAQNLIGVRAEDYGSVVQILSLFPGKEGELTQVRITPRSGLSFFGIPVTPNASATFLRGGENIPSNGAYSVFAPTPVELTGLTERLPLGILFQDSDFVGEDPLHNGSSILGTRVDAGNLAAAYQAPMLGQKEYSRSVGGPGSYVALSDGSILEYTPYDAISSPTGARSFRLYRGGGSAYVVGEGAVSGGPVEFSAGGFSEEEAPILKSALLVGKALLVRNYHEEAFATSDTTTEGDELQMVVLTQAILGEGKPCLYNLSGEISPTGYGEGYAAADRYRLAGKPLDFGRTRTPPEVDVPLAPYPSDDPNEPNPCA